MLAHTIAFISGFILDLIIGDPYCLPHPIRLIGTIISLIEKRHLKNDSFDATAGRAPRHEVVVNRIKGRILVLTVCLLTVLVSGAILFLSYRINVYLGIVIESIMTYQILATKSLKVESMKVYSALKNEGLAAGRRSVSMIVGRDTRELDEEGVIKAAVETVAENTSDGIIAPMLYLVIGGPVLAFLYKAVNTMDSMVGYKNEKYIDYGRCAAKTDDVLNYIPSRISALLMIISCVFLGKNYNTKNAFKIFKRDRYNHKSPNSAQTESVCAGALGIKLAGDASYFGKVVKKPYIGDELRKIELEDIKRANNLLYMTAFICEIICEVALLSICN